MLPSFPPFPSGGAVVLCLTLAVSRLHAKLPADENFDEIDLNSSSVTAWALSDWTFLCSQWGMVVTNAEENESFSISKGATDHILQFSALESWFGFSSKEMGRFKMTSLTIQTTNPDHNQVIIRGYRGGRDGFLVVETEAQYLGENWTSNAGVSYEKTEHYPAGGILRFDHRWNNIDTIIFYPSSSMFWSRFALDDLDVSPVDIQLVGVEIETREYDGTTNAVAHFENAFLGGAESDTHVDIDSTQAVAVFEDAEPGENKTVLIEGVSLSGENAGNYTLLPIAVVGDILKIDPQLSMSGLDEIALGLPTELSFQSKSDLPIALEILDGDASWDSPWLTPSSLGTLTISIEQAGDQHHLADSYTVQLNRIPLVRRLTLNKPTAWLDTPAITYIAYTDLSDSVFALETSNNLETWQRISLASEPAPANRLIATMISEHAMLYEYFQTELTENPPRFFARVVIEAADAE